ncbi:MAG: ABC transporter ATP-binding protein [Bryobacterales bacterium]|nr:ABC transporter ATP-binding protein [Bryobacterales bacterium]
MKNQTKPLIRLEGVSRHFTTDEVETYALAGVHLDIHEGEYVAVAGPSGCGKSTLLAIIGLLDSPTEGRYWLRGQPVVAIEPDERARLRNQEIGFVFQSFNLIGDLTVFANVELPLIYRRVPRSERAGRVEEALRRVGIAHRMNHYPHQLSGGQQQRVAIARAICGSPAIVLADEPTGNLDSRNGEAVMQMLEELHAAGSTICIVTHDQRYAAAAQRTIHLFDGCVVAETQNSAQAHRPQMTGAAV